MATDTAGNGVKDSFSTEKMGAVSSEIGKDFYAPTTIGGTTYQALTGSYTSNGYDGYYKANLLAKADYGEANKKLAVTVTNQSHDDIKDWVRVGLYRVADDAESGKATAIFDGSSLAAKTGTGAFQKVYAESGARAKCINTAAANPSETDTTLTTFDASADATPTTIITDWTDANADVYAHFVLSVWLEGCANDPNAAVDPVLNQNTAGGKNIAVTVTFKLV